MQQSNEGLSKIFGELPVSRSLTDRINKIMKGNHPVNSVNSVNPVKSGI